MRALVAVQDESLVDALGDDGIDVARARSLDEGVAALSDGQVEFAVVDERLPYSDDIVIEVRATVDGPDRDRVPILAIAASGPPAQRVRCLPDVRLTAPKSDDLVRAARAIRIRRARQKRVFDQELALLVPTHPDAIDKTGELYVRLMESAGYPEEDVVRLEHTFREAVGNAFEHGNKKDPKRTIHITYLRTAEHIATVVRDEGPGFDYEAFLARAQEVSALEHTRSRRENEARPGGLGVFIMKQTCDQIAFNRSGNAIYLVKRLPDK